VPQRPLLTLSLHSGFGRLKSAASTSDYYVGINASSPNLKRDLQALIYRTKRNLTYNDAWEAFHDTGRYLPGDLCRVGITRRPICLIMPLLSRHMGTRLYIYRVPLAPAPGYPCNEAEPSWIPDVYSGTCWSPSQQCGSYKAEGDCYNREHIWPKSWFGGTEAAGHGSYTDLFELYPSDGYVNGIRGNDPLGYVSPGKVKYESTSNCRFGPCDATRNFGHSAGNCFELPDDLKGKLGRVF